MNAIMCIFPIDEGPRLISTYSYQYNHYELSKTKTKNSRNHSAVYAIQLWICSHQPMRGECVDQTVVHKGGRNHCLICDISVFLYGKTRHFHHMYWVIGFTFYGDDEVCEIWSSLDISAIHKHFEGTVVLYFA